MIAERHSEVTANSNQERHDTLEEAFLDKSSIRIAILGSTGLVGSCLVAALRQQNYDVIPLNRENLFHILSASNPTHVINCMGAGMDVRRDQTREEIWQANFEIPNQILSSTVERGIQFISIGSILEKVNGFSSTYIDSKRNLSASIEISNISTKNAISVLAPIIFGLEIDHVLLSEIITAGKSRRSANLESPDAVREFVHIQDLIHVVIKLISYKEFDVDLFEIGTGVGYRLSSLCEHALSEIVSPAWVFSPRQERTNEYNIVADIDYAVKMQGFKIRFELLDWLAEQIHKNETGKR